MVIVVCFPALTQNVSCGERVWGRLVGEGKWNLIRFKGF